MLTARLRAVVARVRRTTNSDDAGFTLIELLTSMAMLLFLGAMCTSFLVASKTSADRAGSESLMAARVRVAMSSVVHLLQLTDTDSAVDGSTAGRFETTSNNNGSTAMTATHLVFYTDGNMNRTSTNDRTAPLKVDLSFSGTQLVEKTYQPFASAPSGPGNYPTTPSTSLILLGDDGVSLGTGSGFVYCTGDAPAADGTCTATTDPTKVASVAVTMVVTGTNRATQTFTSTAAMPGGSS